MKDGNIRIGLVSCDRKREKKIMRKKLHYHSLQIREVLPIMHKMGMKEGVNAMREKKLMSFILCEWTMIRYDGS